MNPQSISANSAGSQSLVLGPPAPLGPPAKIASTNPVKNVAPSYGLTTSTGAPMPVSPAISNQSTTTLSSDKTKDITDITSKTADLSKTGLTTDTSTGITTSADGKAYTPYNQYGYDSKGNPISNPNPPGSPENPTTANNNPVSTGGYIGDVFYAPGQALPRDANGNYPTLTPTSPANDQILQSLNEQIAQNDAFTASMISNIKSQYDQLIKQQESTNRGQQGLLNTFLLKNGSLQHTQSGQAALGSQINYGIQQIAGLNAKEQADILAAQQAGLQNKFQLQDKINQNIQKTREEKQAAAIKLNDQMFEVNQKLADQKFQEQQDTTKGIQSIAADAAKNGASPTTVTAIANAKTINDAIVAAGGSLQTATGQLGDYLQYKRDTTAKGLTPVDYGTWKDQDDAKQAKAKASEAYSTAYASHAGAAAADAAAGLNNPTDTAPTAGATGITQATGLPLIVFNYLTQGTAALTRMSDAQRTQVMQQANDFLNKNGLDYSTFQSQYKAQNDVLQANVERAANTKVFSGEVAGSADALMEVLDPKDMSKIKSANVLKLLLGQQVNDPTTMKYNFQLAAMGNDLAGYLAASRGSKTPELIDKTDAANLISSGLNKKSIQAFKDSILTNEEKVNKVVNGAVNSAQKSVWDLFGVGSQYKPPAAQVNPVDGVNNYVKANPSQAETIAKLYDVPGATDQDVWDYVQTLNGKNPVASPSPSPKPVFPLIKIQPK